MRVVLTTRKGAELIRSARTGGGFRFPVAIDDVGWPQVAIRCENDFDAAFAELIGQLGGPSQRVPKAPWD